MYDFINNLPLATGICNFNGDFIDVNNVLLANTQLPKSQVLKLNTSTIFADNSLHNRVLEQLLSKQGSFNKKMISKMPHGEIKITDSSVSVLSVEKELMIFQNKELNLKPYSTYDTFAALLDEILEFTPNLDKSLIEWLRSKTFDKHPETQNVIQQSRFHFSTKDFKVQDISATFKIPLDILQGKWTFLIIMVLLTNGTLRFNELLKIFDKSLSARILSLELKKLEYHSLINRKVYPTVPPMVEYGLTEKGKALNSVADVLSDWTNSYGINSTQSGLL